MRRQISSGSPLEAEYGYARALVDGDWVFVSGTTGFDYTTMTISTDVAEQAAQAFRNISDALAQAGCGLEDVVRVRYILPDRDDVTAVQPVLRKFMARVSPAATAIVAGLVDPRMKIEIEATARKRHAE
ncbi:MAG: RidA family protein [Alphaproteobacteria bacterium]|nr:RidA family protein [Alphaproteobacteria bacterium]